MTYSPYTSTFPGQRQHDRPTVLTGMAVAGVTIAGLSILACVLAIAYAVAIYKTSQSARDRLLRNAPAALPASSASDAVQLTAPVTAPIGPQGLEPPQRAMIVDAIGSKIQFTPEQARQLDALLAECGGEIFQQQDALSAIGDRIGQMPAPDSDQAGPVFFETSAGRAELFNNRAAFYRNNTIRPVRVTAGRRLNASGCPILLRGDVDALIALIQSSSGGKLSVSQVRGVQSLLNDPNQHLVAMSLTPEGAYQIGIQGAAVRPDGYAIVSFSGGPILLGPKGNSILQADRDAIPAVDGRACGAVAAEGILSILLAGFLLFISIRLLRKSRRNLGLFRVYALVKLLLAVAGGLAVGWMINSFVAASPEVSKTGGALSVATIVAFAAAGVGAAFPVTVLLILRLRSVREFQSPTA